MAPIFPVLHAKAAEPRLLCIPEELILEIAYQLGDDVAALGNLRLGSKKLANVAATALFEEAHVALIPRSLKNLDKIASNGHFARMVKRVVLHGQMITQESSEDWLKAVQRAGLQLSEAENQKMYFRYAAYAATQAQFIDSLKFNSLSSTLPGAAQARESFEAGIAQLVNLSDVRVVSYEDGDNNSNFWRKYGKKIGVTPANWRALNGFSTIAEASINNDAFHEHKGREEGYALIASLLQALSNLPDRLSRLKLTTAGGELWKNTIIRQSAPLFAHLVVLDVTAWQIGLDAPEMGACITACVQLKELHLRAKSVGPVSIISWQTYHSLFDVLHYITHWPALTKLTLDIQTSQPALLKACRSLKTSLKTLNLRNVFLRPLSNELADAVTMLVEEEEEDPDWKKLALTWGSWEHTITEISKILTLADVSFVNLYELHDPRHRKICCWQFVYQRWKNYVQDYVLRKRGSTEEFVVDQRQWVISKPLRGLAEGSDGWDTD
ncbi:hypothetical protein BU16DRAFT_567373 [Lophium mytilinum]|uniref:Uncharacterized protein n=1 Tax=Lophium mytilinum TaxID=390894 RepID=A0A6A6QAW6_9PEZI|nr:hypothetical protein BU16DRAFT_567373 [Lophium mytilinum]